jgi:hypothetical protein
MKANYSSRGYQVYGDSQNVKKDADTIREILGRQGVDLLLEVIANNVGNNVVEFKLSPKDVDAIKASYTLSLYQLIDERT